MNYNCDNIVLDRKPLVSNVLQSWINESFFQLRHFKVYWAFAGFTERDARSFVGKICPHLYSPEYNTAKWSKLEVLASAEPYYWWPYITFFIGHKWSTSVSTCPCFHMKHLNRDSSPISVAPLCLNQHMPSISDLRKSDSQKKDYFRKRLIMEQSNEFRDSLMFTSLHSLLKMICLSSGVF